MKQYHTVIFDLDGTLLNTLEDLTDSVNWAMQKYGYPLHTIEEVRGFVGNGLHKLVERALPDGVSEEKTEEIFSDFTTHYKENCAIKTRPYDGILKLLEELEKRKIKIGIVSNKGDAVVKELNQYYFNGKIKVAIGERAGMKRKPAKDSVIEALKELSSKKEDAIYIGDSEVDVMTAKNAGLFCISVTWGFRGKAFLEEHGATCFVDAPEEILSFVTGS